jgi:hypothetical protein
MECTGSIPDRLWTLPPFLTDNINGLFVGGLTTPAPVEWLPAFAERTEGVNESFLIVNGPFFDVNDKNL